MRTTYLAEPIPDNIVNAHLRELKAIAHDDELAIDAALTRLLATNVGRYSLIEHLQDVAALAQNPDGSMPDDMIGRVLRRSYWPVNRDGYNLPEPDPDPATSVQPGGLIARIADARARRRADKADGPTLAIAA